MKRNYLFIGIALMILLVVGLMLWFSQNNKLDWKETYKHDLKDPFGTFLIQQLLANRSSTTTFELIKNPIHANLPIETQNANYVFIGEGMYIEDIDVTMLLDFVNNGNRVFISSRTMPYQLSEQLFELLCDDNYWSDYNYFYNNEVSASFEHPELLRDTMFSFQYKYKHKTPDYRWQFIDDYYFCNNPAELTPIGYIDTFYVNFARIPYGEGAFYFHTNPLFFTNIQLLEQDGFEYADRVFAHLQDGSIYWDVSSLTSEAIAQNRNTNAGHPPNKSLPDKSPLHYILSQTALLWAWYLLLTLGVLFIFFYAKRRQRIIPILPQKKNTSLAFVNNIGHLMFAEQDHKQLALEKMNLFLSDIRNSYRLNTLSLDEQFIERLSYRSAVEATIVEKIVRYYKNIEQSNFVSENTLIEFYQLIQLFYQQTKLIR